VILARAVLLEDDLAVGDGHLEDQLGHVRHLLEIGGCEGRLAVILEGEAQAEIEVRVGDDGQGLEEGDDALKVLARGGR
jgi:hypothetical protein